MIFFVFPLISFVLLCLSSVHLPIRMSLTGHFRSKSPRVRVNVAHYVAAPNIRFRLIETCSTKFACLPCFQLYQTFKGEAWKHTRIHMLHLFVVYLESFTPTPPRWPSSRLVWPFESMLLWLIRLLGLLFLTHLLQNTFHPVPNYHHPHHNRHLFIFSESI